MKLVVKLVSAALIAMTLAGCNGDRKTVAEDRRDEFREPTPVPVVRRDIVGYEFLDGELHTPPESQAVAYAPYSAPVERVLTTVGQRVRRGEVLVELAGTTGQTSYEQARADVQAAQAALAAARTEVEAPVRQVERELADLRARERALRQATDPSGDASELVQATQARRAAEAALTQARAQARQELLPYTQQVQLAQARLQQAQADARTSSISAPISGVVLSIDAAPGREVSEKQSVARIVDLDDVRVHAELAPREQAFVSKDLRVLIRFAELEDEVFEGRVQGIRNLPENDGEIEKLAVIFFENDKGLVKPGMTVRSVAVQTGRAEDALVVPVQAVDKDDTGRSVVRVLTNGEWIPTVVETGLSDGDYIQIKSGLEEGQTVQVTP